MFCKKLFMILLLLMIAGSLSAQSVIFEKPRSPRIANYNIDVELDTSNRTLSGRETLMWRNTSDQPVQDLQFHLYLNAFRNNASTFMIEAGGRSRSNSIDKDGWGFINVDKISIADREMIEYLEFLHPDTDHPDDKTVCRIPLFRSLKPGQTIEVEIEFTAKLPTPPFARTGAKADYFFVGQWFPKIGVFENGAWNCHQFHATTEFFADYGVYNVHINVPQGFIVGATGLEQEVVDNENGTATHFYHAEDVHDFAWTASPDFVEVLGKEQDVDIRVLMQKDGAYQGQRHLEAEKIAVRNFQDWYGDYPFPNLTVVDPRRGAGGSGGMEYPTLITAGTAYGMPEGVYMPETVIVHEFGHNYWYHLLASNEFEESWMDEGINSYTEAKIMDHNYNNAGVINMGDFQLGDAEMHRMRYLSFAQYDPMLRRGWEYYNGGSYGANSYSRPASILLTLDNYLGADVMHKVMQAYVKKWRFKHPKSQDFVDVVNEVSGQDMSWYFDQILYSNAKLDYSVAQIFSQKIAKKRGFDFDEAEAESTADSLETPEMDAAQDSVDEDTTAMADSGAQKEEVMYESRVNIRRLGDFKFPVEIEVTFENGEKIRENWDGQELWKKFRYIKNTKLKSATVDPDNKIFIDANFTNNSRVLRSNDHGLKKLFVRMIFWLQAFLDMPEITAIPFSMSK